MRTLVILAVGLAVVAALPARWAPEEGRARGRTLFELCTQCHGPAGGGSPLALAPAIGGLSQWYVEAQLRKFRGRVRGAHPADLSGMRMAPMSRTLETDDDVRAVAAYVAGLPAAQPEPLLDGGDSDRGKVLFAVCSACHGPDASGNEKLSVPPLNRASDWYLLAQLEKFKAGVRGANPADTTGLQMRAIASTLVDEQAMKDVIAYIGTLRE